MQPYERYLHPSRPLPLVTRVDDTDDDRAARKRVADAKKRGTAQ